MDTIVLDRIAFEPDLPALFRRLRMGDDSPFTEDVTALAQAAQPIARPKAVYGLAPVDCRGEDSLTMAGVVFTSRILRVNLDKAHRAFPYVATCGTELEQWAAAMDDMLARFWADAIMEQALGAARRALDADVRERFAPGKVSRMSPGSLEDWPLPQQAPLFSVLGDVEAQVGVRLTDSFLMLPAKSVSGILFPTEDSYENCMLCPREECPGRRAPYDAEMYSRRYEFSETR